MKTRQLEERLSTLESLVYEKDLLIHDLQRKLDQTIRVSDDENRFEMRRCLFLFFSLKYLGFIQC